jgi:predicted ATPase
VLRDKVTDFDYLFNEVGFGLSQVIPILMHVTGSKTSLKQNFLTIEEPELHLHPKLQSMLADLFVSHAKNNNHIIVETHSEYLIRKLQVLVARKDIKREDVIIYYVTKDEKNVSSVKEMRLDEEGMFLDKWPDDFFDNTFKLFRELVFVQGDRSEDRN